MTCPPSPQMMALFGDSRVEDRSNQVAQTLAGQNVRKLGDEAENVFRSIERLSEHFSRDFVLAFGERIGRDAIEAEAAESDSGIPR